jgi:hypothetical protein
MGQSFGLCARKFLSFFPRNALTRRGTNFSVFTMMEASATYPAAEASIPTVDLTDVAEEEPEEEEEEELRFLGSIKCQIVGIRYYRGEARLEGVDAITKRCPLRSQQLAEVGAPLA